MLLKSAVVGDARLARRSRRLMPLLGGLVPIPVVISMVADSALGADPQRRGRRARAWPRADYAMQRRQVGKQTRMTKDEVKQEHKQAEGDPLRQERDPVPPARGRPQPDDGRHPERRRRAGQPDPRRGRAALRRRAGRAAGGRPRRRRDRRARSARRPPRRGCRWSATSRWPGRSTPPRKVGQEIPPELYAAVAQVLAFVISRRSHGQPRRRAPQPARRGRPARRTARPAPPQSRPRRNPSAPPAPSR